MNIIKKIKFLFNRSKKERFLYEQCAYHESGHIVMAYLSGFTCKRVTILQNGSGDGFTEFDYGESSTTILITSIINFSEYPEEFYLLSKNIQADAPQVASKICGTLLGGPVSEALHKAGVGFEGELPIEVAGSDCQRVNSISFFLSGINGAREHNQNIIPDLYNVVHFLRKKKIWKVIDTLSNDILHSSTRSLNQQEIENSLQKSGYLDIIKSKMCP